MSPKKTTTTKFLMVTDIAKKLKRYFILVIGVVN